MQNRASFGVLTGLILAAWSATVAQASVSFDVAGIGGSGATAKVTLSFNQVSSNTGALVISIQNTSPVGGQIVGFAFNVPTVAESSISKIGGVSSNGAVVALSPSSAYAAPGGVGAHEAGWYGKWTPDAITASAGQFDFGVMNQKNWNDFATAGSSTGPRILSTASGSDTTVFALKISGSGSGWLNASDVETAFMNSLSSSQNGYNFAVRFNGLSGPFGADTAVAMGTSTNPVPVPGAAVMAALGLGLVGLIRRRQF